MRTSMFCPIGGLAAGFALLSTPASAEYREVTDPSADEEPAEAPDGFGETAAPDGESKPPVYTAVGLMGFAVLDKVMPGLGLRIGKTLGARLETSFLWTTQRVPGVDAVFLGNQFGLYFEATPLSGKHYDLNVGLGADIYYLWGVHSEFVELALSPELNGAYWFSEHLGAFLGARGYPLTSSGLELGTTRSGGQGNPVLLFAGLQWRTP